jgi:D-glycero-beta-D-manno-heptose-7-phosphate kinase
MRVLVIGDSCTDKFVYCTIDRICPEAPVPLLNPITTISNMGMASNVSINLTSLGVESFVITNHETITKTRYVDIKSGQMIMRLDENDTCKPYQQEDIEFNYDAIIISDYNKGFLCKESIASIIDKAKCPVFLDTKKQLGKWSSKATYIKINKPEWDNNKDYPYDNIIVTLGSDGATFEGKTYETKKVKVSDVSGAGDTFMAGLVYEYIKTNDITKAIQFANECASKVVQERGVTTI